MWHPPAVLVALAVVAAGCGGATGSTPPLAKFSLSNARVDSFICPQGSNNLAYDIHATIDADNSTSSAVYLQRASAVLTAVSVHGNSSNQIRGTFDKPTLSFAPDHFGAGSKTTLHLTAPGACTNTPHQPGVDTYVDFAVRFTIYTDAGTFTLDSVNKHRLSAP